MKMYNTLHTLMHTLTSSSPCLIFIMITMAGSLHAQVTDSVSSVKNIIIDAETYPLADGQPATILIYGGGDYSAATEARNYVGDVNISTNGGYAHVLVGGNHGNAAGSSFTGDTTLNISTNTFVDIGGASYLTQEVDSYFTGSSRVNITEVLDYYVFGQAINHQLFNGGVVAGGYLGGLDDTPSTGTSSHSIITGNTTVAIDLAGKSGTFGKVVTGGSAHYGGIDSTIEGTSSTIITNSNNITFSRFVMGGAFTYSPIDGEANSGLNKSNISVGATKLTIDSGTFNGAVIGGGFSVSAGDLTTGDIEVKLTGGQYNSYITGGSAIGISEDKDFVITDSSAGKLVTENVVMNLYNIDSNHIIVGGHLVGGDSIYDSTELSSIGNITINIGGYNDSGQALSGTYKSIIGGSRIISAFSDTFEQGDIVINLETGTIESNAEIAAAGLTLDPFDINSKTAMTTKSTTIKIGGDMAFQSNVTVRGAYTKSTEAHTEPTVVTGNKLLHFDDESYTLLAQTSFFDFDEVKVDQAAAHAQLKGNTTIATLDASQFTKSGAGELSVEAGASRSKLIVESGRINITTDQTNSTVGVMQIASGATASTDELTISNGNVKGTGLSANDVQGAGTLLTNLTEVEQVWVQQNLEVYAANQFTMKSAANVHLEALSTQLLTMEDSSQLRTEALLRVTSIQIDDYLGNSGANTPYIIAQDMMNDDGDSFTFNFSKETIAHMLLDPDMKPYLLADLDTSALTTAAGKSFTFQIDGIGTTHTQEINGSTYYLGTIQEDIYIFAENDSVPEPTTVNLGLLALAGMLMRRRRGGTN